MELFQAGQDGKGTGRCGVVCSIEASGTYLQMQKIPEYQLRAGRGPWPPERNIQSHTKLSRMQAGRKTAEGSEGDGAGRAEAELRSLHRRKSLGERRSI